MRIPLQAIGSTPPRSFRGRTILPAGLMTPATQWGLRGVVSLFLLLTAPLAIPVTLWWAWGLRKRLWRWYVPVAGLVAGVLLMLVWQPKLAAGVLAWRWFLERVAPNLGPLASGGALHWGELISSGWVLGTITGAWMSFLAWYRTPPWRDRPRPKTVWRKFQQRKLESELREGRGDKPGVVTFGYDTDTGVPVELPWQDTEGHMLVLGAPGTGKTTTALKAVRASIRDEMFTAIVDMKGDEGLIKQVSAWCARWNRPLWVYSEHGPCRYDPFRYGNFTSKADLLVAASEWSEVHYMTASLDYLRTLFKLIEALPERAAVEGDFAMVQRLLDFELLRYELEHLKGQNDTVQALREEVADLLNRVMRDERAIGGLPSRIRTLRNSHLGQWTRYDEGTPHIDLQHIWDQGGVVLFSIPTMIYKRGAEAFGGLVINDLTNLASRLQAAGNTKPGLVFVDEFSHAGVHNVTPALAMARSSKLRWMLVTQDLGDLRKGANGAADEQKILTDTNIKIVHGVGDPDSADKISRLAGMKWGVSERSAVNLADSAIDITTGTQSGSGFVNQQAVPAIEATDVLHQGAGASSRFILLNKPGEFAITGAHTVIDLSTFTGEATAVQHLPVPGSVIPPRPRLKLSGPEQKEEKGGTSESNVMYTSRAAHDPVKAASASLISSAPSAELMGSDEDEDTTPEGVSNPQVAQAWERHKAAVAAGQEPVVDPALQRYYALVAEREAANAARAAQEAAAARAAQEAAAAAARPVAPRRREPALPSLSTLPRHDPSAAASQVGAQPAWTDWADDA